MPVRPLTTGEQEFANGQPATGMLALLGASQGLLTHLRVNGIAMSSKNLMPSPFAKVTLPLFVIGGFALGQAGGMLFFGDDSLRRLQASHQLDAVARTDAQKYIPAEKL